MKVLSAEQIRNLDRLTIEQEPILSIDLMERASLSFVSCFEQLFPAPQEVFIVCGPGNNGGDGLAVARLLAEASYVVSVQLLVPNSSSPDYAINLERLESIVGQNPNLQILQSREAGPSDSELPAIHPDTIFIDAIFGSGLNRSLEGRYAAWVDWMNDQGNLIVSVDMPSGLFADRFSDSPSVFADFTISFELPKLAFFFASNAKRLGHSIIVPIGLDQQTIQGFETDYSMFIEADAWELIPNRPRHGHKGSFGHALLWVGSFGKMGAGILSAKACLRSGVGLLTVQIPSCGYEVFQVSLPEAMLSVDTSQRFLEEPIQEPSSFEAIGLGPGIDQHSGTEKALEKIIKQVNQPLVLDADALNLLSKNQVWFTHLPKGSVLTPHPKEFERLFGKTANDFDRLELAQAKAKQHHICIVLKGAYTAVISPEGKVSWNSTGNPGMGTAGAGDVLTGIITGLIAQGLDGFDAARLGVYLHGLAGDRAAAKKGEHTLIASDIIDQLGKAFLETINSL